MFGIATMTISIAIFTYQPHVFGIVCCLSGLLTTAMPILGQEISSSAEEFAKAAYACNWNDFDKKNRKAFAIILMMAQKVAGVSSGGFHFSNNLEIWQVKPSFFFKS